MGSLAQPGRFAVSRIAIIGAGPSGICAAKYFLAESCFEKIDVFEQQGEVGGVWHYTPLLDEQIPIPSTTPHVPLPKPIWPKGAKAPIFSNPMYERLNTNIPKDLMAFNDRPFPESNLLFPSRQNVQEYLVKYAQNIRHLIHFSTQVVDVRSQLVDGTDKWEVVSESTITGSSQKSIYDAVFVASGHYTVPYVPSVPGMNDFKAMFPDAITHSKIYRSPREFAKKKIIVVGNGPSGLDISTQISVVSQKPVLLSVTTPNASGALLDKEEVPRISEYLPNRRGVRFEDGRIEDNIDFVLYCTGYLYTFPFLESIEPPLVTTGRRGLALYKHLISIDNPTLAFPVMMQKVIPFPVSSVQSAVVAKLWSNKLELPEEEAMRAWERKRAEEFGEGTSFHILGYPSDAEYINELHEWAKSADDGFTKEPAFWDKRACYTREVFAEIRKRFVGTGGHAKTMEELGFSFDDLELQIPTSQEPEGTRK
ncbi:FAD/NAD(P)-binding protein [Glarea lozoyensis ATCC 20868]|uniref:FAD/NAD(P)-binding protein n=1 Tax=Glarea lozoyensis (strain ATCC 20868 / MF5171) TaxID=1116229 RepID=S3CZ38_GLAL2|nr:FAD/NAD(P)-binding protein [Glarea lozoyensis ATCC 20868]EPE25111.1 FAD/NAD(P)-binding protein [Glarea lozoyensis ATCC 20868]